MPTASDRDLLERRRLAGMFPGHRALREEAAEAQIAGETPMEANLTSRFERSEKVYPQITQMTQIMTVRSARR